MNESKSSSGFNNKGVTIIIDDGLGDTTVRPAPPELRKHLEAEREKIRKWKEEQQRLSREQPEQP